ncbi:hypothetical protein [Salmonirosea aquatica]|uniref:Uncharacterized protein n=1 Tax=Salmonirosea aquatica TaxID=2654236 RepID=A0A7C9BM86_9BACT|nr:hypothetical protein [Cytophagaceae bacterium SJW1-29]
METTDKHTIQDDEKVSKGILFCRKLMASKREMQEEARRDMEKPEIQAIVQELMRKLENEGKSV